LFKIAAHFFARRIQAPTERMQALTDALSVQAIRAKLAEIRGFPDGARQIAAYAIQCTKRSARVFTDEDLEHLKHVLSSMQRAAACCKGTLEWIEDQLDSLAHLRGLYKGEVYDLKTDLHEYAAQMEELCKQLPKVQALLKASIDEAFASIFAYNKLKALDCTACYTSFPTVLDRERHQEVCKKFLRMLK
jgi:hypothetical protein